MNPSRSLNKGVICGVRVEDIPEPTIQEIRYLDKLIDELAKGRRWRRSCGNDMIAFDRDVPSSNQKSASTFKPSR